MARRRNRDKLSKKAKEKKDFRRASNNRSKRGDIIIACEDSVSSPSYFQTIIDNLMDERKVTPNSIVIIPHDGCTHPSGVLNNLKNYMDDNGRTYKEFDYKWIVIDRDRARVNGGGHTAEDFNNAIRNAKSRIEKSHIDVAYANDSFELWYLLHFVYRTTAISRDETIGVVIAQLKLFDSAKFSKLTKDNIKQEKYVKLIYETLLTMQNNAIGNAEKLLITYGAEHNPEKDNPSTTIHKLVHLLNSFN